MLEGFIFDFGLDLSQELEEEAKSTSMILLVGQTGAGKSHFINALAPGRCKESARLESCTQQPSAIDIVFDGKLLLLIDTPGFNDTRSRLDRSDAVILSEIARLIAIQSECGVKMKGIIYLHDILTPRMTGEAVRQLQILQKICGEDAWNHVTFVTTKWPDDEHQRKYDLGVREGDLRRGYWRNMIRNGSKMYRFQDNQESAQTIVRSLTQHNPVEFALQKEMNQGKTLADTSAGQFVIGERQSDESRYRDLQRNLSLDPTNARLAEDAKSLYETIEIRKKGEEQLGENVQETVKKDIRTRMREEFKKTGRKPTVVTIVSWLLSLTSAAINLVQLLGA